MQRFFKTSVFLAAVGMAALITAQPSPALAETTAASTTTDHAEQRARLNAELEEKRARAAKNRAVMQQKVKDGNKKFSDMAGMDENDQKEVDARVKKMLREQQAVVIDDQATQNEEIVQNEKPRHVIRRAPEKRHVYKQSTSRAAPEYLKDSLELVESLKKKHAPYSPPPLKR